MHDIRSIRQAPHDFDAGLQRRGLPPRSDAVLALDERRRQAQTDLQALQQQRNAAAKAAGAAKARGDDAAFAAVQAETATLKDAMQRLETQEATLAAQLLSLLETLPNLPAADVPEGPDETGNVEVRRVGTPRTFDFTPQTHDALGTAAGILDFENAARTSGARFVYLRGLGARLERALANFMLDLHTREFGYTETAVPLLVRDGALYGTGQLPKFADDLFAVSGDYRLIPTAEVPLTNLVADRIVHADTLPLRFTAASPCFRSEAEPPDATPRA